MMRYMLNTLLVVGLLLGELIHGAVVVFIVLKHKQQNEELFNRFMAGDYQTYRYHKDVTPALLKEREEKLKAAMKAPPKSAVDLEKEARGKSF